MIFFSIYVFISVYQLLITFRKTFPELLGSLCQSFVKCFEICRMNTQKCQVRWLTVDVSYLETIHRASLETRIKCLPADGNWGLKKHFNSLLPPSALSSCFSLTCCSQGAGELLVFSANFIHTAQSLHWKWSTLAHVASLFFSWHKGGFAKLKWNQQVPVLLHLLEMPTWSWVCVLGLVQKYRWQIGFKLIVTGLLWHHRDVYVSEVHPLRSRFYLITKNASVYLC